MCVDLIGPYKIHIKGKEPLILKYITTIDPVTKWFEVTQYRDKKTTAIANLVVIGYRRVSRKMCSE